MAKQFVDSKNQGRESELEQVKKEMDVLKKENEVLKENLKEQQELGRAKEKKLTNLSQKMSECQRNAETSKKEKDRVK